MKVLVAGMSNLEHQGQQGVIDSITSLLKKMGVDYQIFTDEVKCWEATLNLGFEDISEKVSKEFKEKAEATGADLIISSFAAGVQKWKAELPNQYGLKLEIPYLHISQFIADEFKKSKPNLAPFPYKYFVQHGCTLGRKMKGFQAIRDILSYIPEIKVLEEEHPTAELEKMDKAEFNTCPGSWLNFTQPELGDYIKENYVLSVLSPVNPDYAGSTCANGHYGIVQGLEIAEIEDIKPLYFTELLDRIWR